MNKETMFSSKRNDWATPWSLFKQIDEEFHFTLDVCADERNTKVPNNYFDEEKDGLRQVWSDETCWMNPPYGREITDWVKKAYLQSHNNNTRVICLLPARTDTRWFHNYCWKSDSILFMRGRIKFDGHKNSAPFPSCVVTFGCRISEDSSLQSLGKVVYL